MANELRWIVIFSAIFAFAAAAFTILVLAIFKDSTVECDKCAGTGFIEKGDADGK